jgi:hypothetical protein
MSCTTEDTLEIKAGHVNVLPLKLQAGSTPIDLTGATILLTAYEPGAEEPLISEEVTVHTAAEAGESSIVIDLTEVSDEIRSAGARLAAEILVLDSLDRLVYDRLFTIQILRVLRPAVDE